MKNSIPVYSHIFKMLYFISSGDFILGEDAFGTQH